MHLDLLVAGFLYDLWHSTIFFAFFWSLCDVPGTTHEIVQLRLPGVSGLGFEPRD